MQKINLYKALARHDIRTFNHHIDKDYIRVNDKKIFLTQEQYKAEKGGKGYVKY